MVVSTSFRDELRAAVDERHCADHPMTDKWARGELGRDALMGWGVEHYHWISNIRPNTFYKLAKAPPDVREMILENFQEENDPNRPHLPIVLKFAQANGADIDAEREMSIIYDNRARIALRVRQLLTGKHFTQTPQSRLRRLVVPLLLRRQEARRVDGELRPALA